MWKNLGRVFWILISSELFVVNCEYFSIVGPKTLRVDEPYKVAVTSHDQNGEISRILVGLEGIGFDGEEFEISEDVEVSGGKTKIVKLKLSNLSSGKFNLTASNDNFSKSVSLYCNSQKVSLLVQLSKPIYKPESLVEFRIFAINSRTKPYRIKETSKVWILDPGNNQVKLWKDPQFFRGLFEGSFQLVDAEPGVWKVLVEADGELASKSFEIHKDTRSIFELLLSTPSSSVSYRDGSIKVKVKVNAVVKNSIIGSSGFKGTLNVACNERGVTKFQKNQRIEDETVLEIDFKNDLGLFEVSDTRNFHILVNFIDDATNKTFKASTTFNVEMSDYIISIVHSPQFFKPGIPYTFTLLVTKVDGYPVLNSKLPVEVTVKDDSSSLIMKNYYSLDPNTGGVEIEVSGISMNASHLNITVKYEDLMYAKTVHKFKSNQKDFLSINVLTPRPKMYERVEFQLISTSQVPSVVFQLFSKGVMKISRIIELDEGVANFTVIPKFSYTPKAHCIVFFITESGEIVSDSITLFFENVLPNYASLTLSSEEVKPGGAFVLNVTSTLNSSVSLVAVDQRAFSMPESHGITQDFIFNQVLMKYNEIPSDFLYDPEIPFWFYEESYQKKFIDVGAVILTNAKQDFPCETTETTQSGEVSTEAQETDPTAATSAPTSFPLSKNGENEAVDRFFIDTFLFKTILIKTPLEGSKLIGVEFLNETAPELTTSWIITGISISKKFGIGITTNPAVLNAFLHFYIDFSVPISIKFGEIIQLEFLVVNLLEEDLNSDVIFFNLKGEFEVIRPLSYNWTTITSIGHSQNVAIQKQSIYRFRIEIKPKFIGFTDLKISVKSSKAGDQVERQLLVIPEGFPSFENHAEFVFLDECEPDGKELNFSCSLPAEALNETVQVEASVSGDILGPALLNLESLIRMPSGCGEQTMINFVPNVVALEYLTATGQLTSKLNETAKKYLESGFQRMLQYRRNDGSFSAFGKVDKNGSSWLTAYVVKYFRGAQKFITIDEQVIKEALQFIMSKQEPDGKFREDGVIFHKSLQSGTGSGVAFTSYLAAVVQDNVGFYPQYKTVVENAINYVKVNSDSNDVYSLSLVTYLLHHANDNEKFTFFSKFLTKAINTKTYIHWKNPPPSTQTSSLDIEITSYALLIIDKLPQFYQDGFKVIKWLVSQQNSRGGFLSTQDTVVGLQAMAKFGSKFSTKDTNLTVNLWPEFGPNLIATINHTTSLITQKFKLQPNVRKLKSFTKGKGFAIVQLSCSFYRNSTVESPSFNLSVSFGNESCDNKLALKICATFVADSSTNASNMAVFTIDFPSGFSFDADTKISPEIQKIEELSKSSSVNVYLNNVSTEGTCFSLIVLRNTIVYKTAPSNIEVFDYYDTNRRASISYKIPKKLPPCRIKPYPSLPNVEEFTTTETFAPTPTTPKTSVASSSPSAGIINKSSISITSSSAPTGSSSVDQPSSSVPTKNNETSSGTVASSSTSAESISKSSISITSSSAPTGSSSVDQPSLSVSTKNNETSSGSGTAPSSSPLAESISKSSISITSSSAPTVSSSVDQPSSSSVPTRSNKISSSAKPSSSEPIENSAFSSSVKPSSSEPSGNNGTSSSAKPSSFEPIRNNGTSSSAKPSSSEPIENNGTSSKMSVSSSESSGNSAISSSVKLSSSEPSGNSAISSSVKPSSSEPSGNNGTSSSAKPSSSEPIGNNGTSSSAKPSSSEPSGNNGTSSSAKPSSSEPSGNNGTSSKMSVSSSESSGNSAISSSVKPSSSEPSGNNAISSSVKPSSSEPSGNNGTSSSAKPSSDEPSENNINSSKVKPSSSEPSGNNITSSKVKPSSSEPSGNNITSSKVKLSSSEPSESNESSSILKLSSILTGGYGISSLLTPSSISSKSISYSSSDFLPDAYNSETYDPDEFISNDPSEYMNTSRSKKKRRKPKPRPTPSGQEPMVPYKRRF